MALLGLVADLYRFKDVRREFNTDPEAVIKKYDLTDAEKKTLYTMRLADVSEAVKQEILDVNFDFLKGEFPRTGEMFYAELDETSTEYPAPTPEIFRVRPKTAKVADGKFELNVFGQSFSRDAQVRLRPKDNVGPVLVVKGHKVFGTFRCSHARGVVTPGVAKIYVVQIQNSPSAGSPPAPIDGPEFVLT